MENATIDKRANRYDVVSRLADDLAHEIRNPLNAIVVNLEVLRRRIGSGASDKALELTDVIDEEIARLARLVDQLVFLMRPPRLDAHPIPIDETIGDMRPVLETQASAARIEFEMETASALFTRVPRDVVRFALLNLLTSLYVSDAVIEKLRIESRAGESFAEIAVTSHPAAFEDGSEYVRQARALLEPAGGKLEIGELSARGTGSTAVLRIPASRSFI
ncbi:MAG TPA: histidine kinase dimerization/phospho-acceptor domain-containing protein [Longimicrobiales bacterium]